MKKDFNLLYNIMQMTQAELFSFLKTEMKKYYNYIDNSGKNENFIYCRGTEPVLLVAHLDTVFEEGLFYKNSKYSDFLFDDEVLEYDIENTKTKPDKEIYYDNNKGVMWSPDGLGADDRAGVYMILTMLKQGLRPYVLFTTDEETGGYGAKIFAHRYEKLMQRSNIKYLIELDRHGFNDCVFYSCYNKEFEEYINGFGFETKIGSFSDISIICPAIGIAGVNLSVGYFNEHSTRETLNIFTMSKIYDIICNMVKQSKSIQSRYIYVERLVSPVSSIFKFNTDFKCAICDGLAREFVRIDKIGFVCLECIDCMEEPINEFNDIRV